jgi:hypothetical protein
MHINFRPGQDSGIALELFRAKLEKKALLERYQAAQKDTIQLEREKR